MYDTYKFNNLKPPPFPSTSRTPSLPRPRLPPSATACRSVSERVRYHPRATVHGLLLFPTEAIRGRQHILELRQGAIYLQF